MRIALACFLFAHGLAHLPGFIIPWRLATMADMPYKTTLLSDRINAGDVGIRIVGVLYLLAALSFAASGAGLLIDSSAWLLPVFAVAAFSLVLCVLSWPEARVGVYVNLAIFGFLLLGTGMNWLS